MTMMHEGVQWVLKATPHPLAEAVAIDSPIEVTFARDLDMTQEISNLVSIKNLDDLSEHPFKVEASSRFVKIIPMFDMQPDAHYMVTINGGPQGLLDVRGGRMAYSWTLEFHTSGEKELKTPSFTGPANQAYVKNGFEISWTPVNGASYYEVEVSNSRSFDPVIWPQYGHKQFEARVAPRLFAKGNYYARVRAVSGGRFSGYSDTILFVLEDGLANPERKQVVEGDWTSMVDEVLDKIESVVESEAGIVSIVPEYGALEIPAGTKEIRIRLSEGLSSIELKDIRLIKERNG
ncbi:hypothetical protein ACQR3P_28540 [Rhodococcus sp. IEGM1300]